MIHLGHSTRKPRYSSSTPEAEEKLRNHPLAQLRVIRQLLESRLPVAFSADQALSKITASTGPFRDLFYTVQGGAFGTAKKDLTQMALVKNRRETELEASKNLR